ncbi:MAG: hypothetical protein MUO57_09550 [Anaerolineales bacterium]|nr:hypothetical protein [Anaerolineales bacterium]
MKIKVRIRFLTYSSERICWKMARRLRAFSAEMVDRGGRIFLQGESRRPGPGFCGGRTGARADDNEPGKNPGVNPSSPRQVRG